MFDGGKYLINNFIHALKKENRRRTFRFPNVLLENKCQDESKVIKCVSEKYENGRKFINNCIIKL